MTEQALGAEEPHRGGASNNPENYDTHEAPNPEIDAVGADSDLGTGLDEERAIGGDAEVDAPMP